MKMNWGRNITESDFQALLPWFSSLLQGKDIGVSFAPWITPWPMPIPPEPPFSQWEGSFPQAHICTISQTLLQAAACSPACWRCWVHFQYLYFCYPTLTPLPLCIKACDLHLSPRMRSRIQICLCFFALCSNSPIKSHLMMFPALMESNTDRFLSYDR